MNSLRTEDGRKIAPVSVIIPVYNRPEGLERAVRSVLDQVQPVQEIIIIDDGSSPPVGPSFSSIPVIRCIRIDSNSGPAVARTTGIVESRAEFVAFLDSDDEWLPTKIRDQMRFAELMRKELVAVTCSSLYVKLGRTRHLHPISATTPDDFASGCWYNPGSTLMLGRWVFDRVGHFDSEMRRLEDYDWMLRFGLLGGRLLVTPTMGAVIYKSRHTANLATVDAATRIRQKYSRRAELSPRLRRKIQAWVSLERAAAARTAGNPLGFAFFLAASLGLAPRTRIHLKDWWQ